MAGFHLCPPGQSRQESQLAYLEMRPNERDVYGGIPLVPSGAIPPGKPIGAFRNAPNA